MGDGKVMDQSKMSLDESKDILSDGSDSDVLVIDMGKKTSGYTKLVGTQKFYKMQ